jgi:uncharacterized YccA/Bax inhibitor family protein
MEEVRCRVFNCNFTETEPGKGALSMRTSNPALSEETFDKFARQGHFDNTTDVMTVEGTANKTGILLLLCVIAASFTWNLVLNPGGIQLAIPLALGGLFGAFIVALVAIFKPTSTPITGPIYAVLEGLALGAVSAILNARFPGIVMQAVLLTFGVMALMLFAYRSRIIRATEKLWIGVTVATASVAIFYLVLWAARMFGAEWGFLLRTPSLLSIGISIAVVGIAALNLILDFDIIESGAARRAPKFMEWYGAFSLMVTLVWLYIEILSLLRKLNSR